ncbi:unnamed protein product, partial [Litomosoides sigmodontis]
MSFVHMDVDISQAKSLGTKQIVAFVNYFMVKNMQLLESFVCDVERRIVDMERRLSRVEVELKLLEHKLDSVPGLQVVIPEGGESSAEVRNDGSLLNTITSENNMESEAVENAEAVDSESSAVSAVKKPHESVVLKASSTKQNLCIRDDPRYAIYFKMR